MTDAPERTLSERMRWDNCICGKGNPNGIGQSGDDWDLDTQCAYCDDADEVAALEQQLEQACANVKMVVGHEKSTVAALEQVKAEVERLRADVQKWEEKRRYHSGYVVYDEDLDELRALTKPEGE